MIPTVGFKSQAAWSTQAETLPLGLANGLTDQRAERLSTGALALTVKGRISTPRASPKLLQSQRSTPHTYRIGARRWAHVKEFQKPENRAVSGMMNKGSRRYIQEAWLDFDSFHNSSATDSGSTPAPAHHEASSP
jgi:hypothetical protein